MLTIADKCLIFSAQVHFTLYCEHINSREVSLLLISLILKDGNFQYYPILFKFLKVNLIFSKK